MAAKKAAKKATPARTNVTTFGTASVPMIRQWSYSRYTTYTKCPFLAKAKFIMKLDEPQAPAMARGAEIHGLAQDFLEGRKKTVAHELQSVEHILKDYKKKKASAEGEMGLTRQWQPTGWFATDVWGRVKIDAKTPWNKSGTIMRVTDWKTGKYAPDRPDYGDQTELYALGTFCFHPIVEEVITELVFTDHDQRIAKPVVKAYTRDQLEGMINSWERKLKPMLNDKRFTPSPGAQCRSCNYRKAVGGPCKY